MLRYNPDDYNIPVIAEKVDTYFKKCYVEQQDIDTSLSNLYLFGAKKKRDQEADVFFSGTGMRYVNNMDLSKLIHFLKKKHINTIVGGDFKETTGTKIALSRAFRENSPERCTAVVICFVLLLLDKIQWHAVPQPIINTPTETVLVSGDFAVDSLVAVGNIRLSAQRIPTQINHIYNVAIRGMQVERILQRINYRFTSLRQVDVIYTTQMEGDLITCNCPGWIFNRNCWHMNTVRELEHFRDDAGRYPVGIPEPITTTI